ncbi:SpoIID/LytB domain-containing protein [Nocardioides taihuensis]|uniref:SpoIID/LytB domain-containing protein n=1 Tax=Nocardioides taihuensis TaxID=1835606 RepID=A0ABW0BG89_9ACTN
MTSPILRRLVGATTLALLAAGLVAAPASADDPYDVPDDAVIHLEGDGAGHGIGMSQYGAYGAANAGKTWRQILDFYYPGTHTGLRGGQVSVWISGDDDRDLVVDRAPGLTVRKVDGRSWRVAGVKASRWRLTPAPEGRTEISYRTGSWHRWKLVRGDAELTRGGAPVTLRTPDGPVDYRGALRSTRHDGTRVSVNVLPMEQYLRGVVPSEMAASSWPQQALRAQAVAARTYAAYEREHTANPDYDLCDTAACQAYGGASAEYSTSDRAVLKTARIVLTYEGQTAFAQYSASNGGYTVAGQFDYLPAQADPFEGTSSDYYGWTRTVTSAQVEAVYDVENLSAIGIETRNGQGPRGGRVGDVRLWSSTGWTGTVTGESFRRNLGLPSTLYEITAVEPAAP